MNRFLDFKRYASLLLIVTLTVIISCKDDESLKKRKKVSTPTLTNPTNPKVIPPATSECATYVLYGYCDKISYDKGEKVSVYIQSNQSISSCRLNIYDLNHKLIFSAPSNALFEQKMTEDDPSVNGYGFVSNASIEIPTIIQSGVYMIEGKIPFIVRETNPVDLLIVYPSNTANAYCESGGKSLYSAVNRPTNVSFERPIPLQQESLPCLSWFTTLPGFQIGYATDMDLDDYKSISAAKIIVIVGHSEYWSRKARRNFDKFIERGGHAIILSGNTMWWQIRYSEDKKKLICHRTTDDPIPDLEMKTIVWAEPMLNYSIVQSIGEDFNHGGYGVRYADDGWDGFKITLPESPLLAGLDFKKGDILPLPTGEYDGAPIKEFVDECPVLDTLEIGAHRVQLIGFDYGLRASKKTVGTFIVMQPKKDSGVIVNVGSIDWCSSDGIGGAEKDKFKKITLNAIKGMLDNKSLFVP